MRIEHVGGAITAKLTADLGGTTGDLSISCDALTNWPTGSVGPFYVTIDRGLITQEKILCSLRSSNTLSVWTDGAGATGRGVDGTSVQSHTSGSEIEHIWTAVEADEANVHLNDQSIHFVTCTSSTRPASPTSGMLIFQTDTQTMYTWNGSVWLQVSPPSTGGYPDLFLLMGA